MIVYGRLLSVNKKDRVFVDIGLKYDGLYTVYTTPTRLKSRRHHIKKLQENKILGIGTKKHNPILKFKIFDLDLESEDKKIRLRQI